MWIPQLGWGIQGGTRKICTQDLGRGELLWVGPSYVSNIVPLT